MVSAILGVKSRSVTPSERNSQPRELPPQKEHLTEYKGRPTKQLHRSLKTAASRAGISHSVCVYDMRHLFASLLLSKGADLEAVCKIPVHTSTKMTADQYYHDLYGQKRWAVELAPELLKEGFDPEIQYFPATEIELKEGTESVQTNSK
jgi:integrase